MKQKVDYEKTLFDTNQSSMLQFVMRPSSL